MAVHKGGKPESRVALVRRARKINRLLAELYPDAHCELDFENPLQLIVATILSAQCTDVRVNQVTPALFRRYETAEDYASAERVDLEELIRPTGFYRNKATSILGLGRELCDRFGGEVPGRLADLVTLPGVGRKTANVVLGNAFGVPGLTVDTHFGRLVRRFGWTEEEDPVKVEHVIGELFPRAEWTMLSHRLIFHGRRICHSRRPACGACPLASLCPSHGIGELDPAKAEALLKPASAREAAALAEVRGQQAAEAAASKAAGKAAAAESAAEKVAAKKAVAEKATEDPAAKGRAPAPRPRRAEAEVARP